MLTNVLSQLKERMLVQRNVRNNRSFYKYANNSCFLLGFVLLPTARFLPRTSVADQELYFVESLKSLSYGLILTLSQIGLPIRFCLNSCSGDT